MAFLLLIGGVRKGTKIGLGYEGVRNCIKCYVSRHIETIGLIPKISVLFSFYLAILLILGINRLIFGRVALFTLVLIHIKIYL